MFRQHKRPHHVHNTAPLAMPSHRTCLRLVIHHIIYTREIATATRHYKVTGSEKGTKLRVRFKRLRKRSGMHSLASTRAHMHTHTEAPCCMVLFRFLCVSICLCVDASLYLTANLSCQCLTLAYQQLYSLGFYNPDSNEDTKEGLQTVPQCHCPSPMPPGAEEPRSFLAHCL